MGGPKEGNMNTGDEKQEILKRALESIRNILCLMVLLLAFVVPTGCATFSSARTNLAKTNLTILKGAWSGTRDFMTGDSARTLLQIDNDTEPIQGKWTVEGVRAAVGVAAEAFVGASPGSTFTIDFKNGHISDQGTFLIIEGRNFVELTLYNEKGRPRLDGWFYYEGAKGTMTLTKQ
jgi:hypothetical protein